MSEKLAQLKKKGETSSNGFIRTITLDANGQATITCPFTPTVAQGHWYVTSNSYGCCVGNNSGLCRSFGYSEDVYYSFTSPYGITISGNNISINTGFQRSFNSKMVISAE